MTRNVRELILLSEHPDLRVAAEDVDPDGWPIVNAEAQECGQVTDLVVDSETMKAVYMLASLGDERHVLLPAAVARLDTTTKVVIFDLLTADILDDLPDFVRLPVHVDDEARIHRAFTGRDPIEPNETGSVDRRRRSRRSA